MWVLLWSWSTLCRPTLASGLPTTSQLLTVIWLHAWLHGGWVPRTSLMLMDHRAQG